MLVKQSIFVPLVENKSYCTKNLQKLKLRKFIFDSHVIDLVHGLKVIYQTRHVIKECI